MFDRYALAFSKTAVDRIAITLRKLGCSADGISFTAFGFGVAAAGLIATGHFMLALMPLLIGRLLDGLDGAVARLGKPTDRGAFLDISLDFLFYASIPLAFAIANPTQNALAGAVLLAAFVGTGSSFLAYAIIAEKRGDKSTAYPSKSFYYLGGLTEGSETIACFVSMMIWPEYFPIFAYGYTALCCITILTRIIAGWQAFAPPKD
jgi:phosphatidylglycerophosphate synthase